MAAPAAKSARAGPEVLGGDGPVDRPPQCHQRALEPLQLLRVWCEVTHLGVLEIEQAQHARHDPAGPPEHQRVELQLEQRSRLECLPGRAPGLVVNHPEVAVRGDVEPVDVAADQQLVGDDRLDQALSLRRLQPPRVLHREVATEQGLCRRDELVQLAFAVGAVSGPVSISGPVARLPGEGEGGELRRQPRLLLDKPGPLRADQLSRALGRPVSGWQVEEALQDGLANYERSTGRQTSCSVLTRVTHPSGGSLHGRSAPIVPCPCQSRPR